MMQKGDFNLFIAGLVASAALYSAADGHAWWVLVYMILSIANICCVWNARRD
jgi:hypothetical protein